MYKIFLLITMLTIGYQNMAEKPIQERQSNINLVLNTFTKIPEEIDGCNCKFYLSEQNEEDVENKREKYIFVNDFASIGFARINGKLEKFELKKFDDDEHSYLYSNKVYVLKIIVSAKVYKNEKSYLKADIILSKGDKMLKKDIIGSCGC